MVLDMNAVKVYGLKCCRFPVKNKSFISSVSQYKVKKSDKKSGCVRLRQ